VIDSLGSLSAVVNATIVEEASDEMDNAAVVEEDIVGTQVDVAVAEDTKVGPKEAHTVGPKEAYTVGPKVEHTEVGPKVEDTRVGPMVVEHTRVGPKVAPTKVGPKVPATTSIAEVTNLTVDIPTMRVADLGMDSDADSAAKALVATPVVGEYNP
jgi:hypothetical protein